MAKGEQNALTRACGTATRYGREGAKLVAERIRIVSEDLIFGCVAPERDVRIAHVAAVVNDDTVSRGGEILGEWTKQFHVLAPARDQQDPRTTLANDVIMDAHTAHHHSWHAQKLTVRLDFSQRLVPTMPDATQDLLHPLQ
jgi:hypothetical protein